MRIKKVTLPHVMEWYLVGWIMWRRDFAHWLLVSLLCLLLLLGAVVAPGLHWGLFIVLPLVTASLFYMARKVAQNKEPSLNQLFFVLSLEEQRNQLLVLGASLLGLMVVVSLMTNLIEPRSALNYSLSDLAKAQESINVSASFWQTFISTGLKFMTLLALVFILMFGPALILFKKMPALVAVQATFKAIWINKGPLLFFLFLQTVLSLFALLPLGLGLLILLPVTVNALYRAYMEIFVANTPRV